MAKKETNKHGKILSKKLKVYLNEGLAYSCLTQSRTKARAIKKTIA